MRRRSFISALNAVARESARSQRQREAAIRRQLREQARAVREEERRRALEAKEAKQRYLEERVQEVDERNEELDSQITELRAILEHTLRVNDMISFDSLRVKDEFRSFSPPQELAAPTLIPQKETFFSSVKPPGFFGRNIPGSEDRYQRLLRQAESRYREALRNYEVLEAERNSKLSKLKEDYEKEKQAFDLKIKQRNEEVDELEKDYRGGDQTAVITYNSMVLERSEYPDGFPQRFRLAYIPDPKELVIEYELPPPEVVPAVAEYRYIKARDVIEEKPRKAGEIKDVYQDAVASVTLRTIHEVFEADQQNHLQVVVFNGYVQTVDPATGKDIRPCLISVRVTRDRFAEIDLGRIEKRSCLRNLGAQVSPGPLEMLPVKPIVEFDMVDKRFVEESDILGDLDARPNLMDLNPFEFENLVTNLFQKMGLETKLTRSSRDGGVDAVAFDARPILGGKVVIQAKRYKNVVGVAAVRDLYGTMINEGANKGILVTTSNYGPDAYDFAKDKPIELVDGGGLLYLLEQVGVKARIIFPAEG